MTRLGRRPGSLGKEFMKKMLLKRSNRKYNRYNRRKYKVYSNLMMARIGNGFPKMIKMRMHYIDNFLLSGIASGTVGTQQFIINGLYDFDYTGTGHQPFYFDQMMSLYDHYCVLGAKITVSFTNTSAQPIVVGGYINDDTAISAPTLVTFQEEPFSKYRLIPNGNNNRVNLTWKWSAKKFFTGRSSSILADTELQGTASANPVENSVLSLYYRNTDITLPTSVSYTVRADFIVVFKELKDITGS